MKASTGTPVATGQGTPGWGGLAAAILGAAVFALGLGALTPSAHAYFWEKTHPKAAEEMAGLVRRQDTDKAYEELYDPAHLDLMTRGSTEEDFGSVAGNARGNRHYYDPDAPGKESGLRYQNYFRIWMYIDLARWGLQRTTKSDFGYAGIEVNKPPSGYYENALEWARNGAGTGDDLNWEGAIRAYGYTKASRDEAYLRLGHVAHLLADMAEPDHVLMLPHPGSDMRSPSSGPAAPGEVVKYGYEGVVEAYLGTLKSPATQIRRRPVVDDYFNEMARTSKQAFQGKAVPPLGLKTVVVTYYHEDLGKTEDYLIPLLPDIPDTPADRAPYLAMADSLLGHAVELGAGILQDFHDIVNLPPYVRSVRVSQGPEPGAESGRYECAWVDGAGVTGDDPAQGPIRTIDRDHRVDMPLAHGRQASILVEFGPEDERIDPGSVTVLVDREPVPGQMATPTTWVGQFTPRLPQYCTEDCLAIEIGARDTHHHRPRDGLPERGYELDSDPAHPAVLALVTPPYDWRDYSPGPDRQHRIRVVRPEGVPMDDGPPCRLARHIGWSRLKRLGPTRRTVADGSEKWGYEDALERLVIPCQFEDAMEFSEGRAAVSVGGKYGFVDEKGRLVIPPKYERWPRPFHEGLALASVLDENGSTQYLYIDRFGRTAISLSEKDWLPVNDAHNPCGKDFNEGLAAVRLAPEEGAKRRAIGYIDPTGKPVLVLHVVNATAFSEGLAGVCYEKEDKDGKYKWGYINRKGSPVINARFDDVGAFRGGRAVVHVFKDDRLDPVLAKHPTGSGIGDVATYTGAVRLLNRKGELLPGLWVETGNGFDFRYGRARLVVDRKTGFIDEGGLLAVVPTFDNARPFAEGLARVEIFWS